LAFDLEREPPPVRERYGRHQFGQSCLLARRLVEAGVALVQVNWFRGPDEPSDAPCWDTHVKEANRLVACLSEFGRSPKINGSGGRDHWGSVFSVALAGGGVKGGVVYGESDRHAAQPKDGRVQPQDLTATMLHCLGHGPDAEIIDRLGRPIAASRGEVIRHIL
jgi:hypothetical protein